MPAQSSDLGAQEQRVPDIHIEIKLETVEITSSICLLNAFLSRSRTSVNLRITWFSPSGAELTPITTTHGQFIKRATLNMFVEQQGSSLVIERLPVAGVTYDPEKRTYNIWTLDTERAHSIYSSLYIPGAEMSSGEMVDRERGGQAVVVVKEDSMEQDWRNVWGECPRGKVTQEHMFVGRWSIRSIFRRLRF